MNKYNISENEIKLAGIHHQSLVNGVGCRKVLFSQGCTHHCKGCHNPETWSFNAGKKMIINEVLKIIEKDVPIIDGVTFSGGDPLEQADKFAKIAKYCKEKLNISVWCYTGYTWEELQKNELTGYSELIKYVDVLVDGPFIITKMTKDDKNPNNYPFVGSTNQRLIDVKKSIKSKKIVLFKWK